MKTLLTCLMALWGIAAQGQTPEVKTRLVVAADGSGDFRTVQAAVDAVPANRDRVTTIFLSVGEYDGLVRVPVGKNRIHLVGEDRKRSIILGLNNERMNVGTSNRALVRIEADDFTLENLTLHNTTPYKGSQAEAFSLHGDRCILRNADFFTYQDTLQLTGRAYVTNCLVEGDVDFIWGYGAAFFDHCELRALHDGYYLQSRNGVGQPGYVFADCRLTATPEVKKNWLARIETGRFPGSQVTFIRCAMGSHIPAAGWLLTGADSGKLRFEEFGTTDLEGKKLDISRRLPGSRQITAAEAASMADAATFLGDKDGWNPRGKR